MATFGLLQLIAYGEINKHFPINHSDILLDCIPFENDMIKLPRMCDTIREIFIIINLPKLDYGHYWKDNILPLIIKNITIDYHNYQLTISGDSIKNLVYHKLDNYDDELLLKNVPLDKRIEMSKDDIQLILPLRIKDFISKPSEILLICTPYNDTIVKIQLNNKNLVEDDETYVADINCGLKFIGVLYTTEIRNNMSHNSQKFLDEQDILIDI